MSNGPGSLVAVSLLGIGPGSGSSCCSTEITLQEALLQSRAESSPAVPELAQGMHAPSAAGNLST